MTGISNHLLLQLSEFVSSVMGLHFPESRWSDLERGISHAASEFGFKDSESFVTWLMTTPLTKGHIEKLAGHLTVGETYFFRDKINFDVLEGDVLKELIDSKMGKERRLRIWSAGCSTGEEPYSIAILLNKLIPDLGDWNITILATDINPVSLRKASKGIYTEWSFRGTPLWVRDRYFKNRGDRHYEILPHIRDMVTFGYLNLAEDVFPSLLTNTNAMDFILSRNVLMYFSQGRAEKVIQRFYNSIVDNGWLIVSPTEAVKSMFPQFVTVNYPDTILYRKVLSYKEAGSSLEFRVTGSGLEPETHISPLKTDPYMEPKLTDLFSHGHGSPESAALLAKTYANQGRLDDAAMYCEKALNADKLNQVYHYLFATILLEQGKINEAVKSLKKVLYLDHDFVLAYFMLGSIMMKQGESDASRKYFNNAFELLSVYNPEDILPESEGMTAGRLSEIIASMTQGETSLA